MSTLLRNDRVYTGENVYKECGVVKSKSIKCEKTEQEIYYDGEGEWGCRVKVSKEMRVNLDKEWKELCEEKENGFWVELREMEWLSECEEIRSGRVIG